MVYDNHTLLQGTTNKKWRQINITVIELAEEACGKSTGEKDTKKEAWWWNDEGKIKDMFKEWQISGDAKKKEKLQ